MTTAEETLHCARHPKRETLVRCGKCDKPLCPECMIMTPVGVRCRECANFRPIPTYDVGPLVLARAALVGFPVAIVLAVLIRGTPISAFGFFLMPFYGWLVAEAIARVSNQKRGLRLQIVAGLAIALGLVMATVLPVTALFAGNFATAAAQLPRLLAFGVLSSLFNIGFLFQVALALVFGVSRLR